MALPKMDNRKEKKNNPFYILAEGFTPHALFSNTNNPVI